jgi:hypothetical protein
MDTQAQSGASGQYKRFDFNVMRRFGDHYLGANDTGLYLLKGTRDNDQNIDTRLRTGATDFGIMTNKRLRFVYLMLTGTGELEIDVIAGNSVVRTYLVKMAGPELHRVRVPVGRDIRGVAWAFELRNLRGASHALHGMEVLPVVLSRGQI